MIRNIQHSLFDKAKKNKNDEFYTQLIDIERELSSSKECFKNDAIHINKTKNIPSDYDGVIGVSITFLHKFNSEQFEISNFRKGNDGKDLRINGTPTFFRILVKRK